MAPRVKFTRDEMVQAALSVVTVSYTHLTLPTIA